MLYQFKKSLQEMSVMELMQEYSNLEWEIAEGFTYECDQLQDCLEQLEKEGLSRN